MEISRRDVILASIAAFIAWGYATHWIPSLRLVPYAFLAGIAVATAGIFYLILCTSLRKPTPSRKDGRVTKKSSVAFIQTKAWEKEVAALKKRSAYRRKSLYPQSLNISDNVDRLLDLILRDFVSTWYRNISSRPSFYNEVDNAVRTAVASILDQILRLDHVELAVSRIVPIITAHIKEFDEAERVVRGRKLSRNVTESEELDTAIAARYRDGRLHPAAALAYSNTALVQQQHLRGIVMRVLPKVMPESMIKSPSVAVLIREIVACAVLSPIMNMLADPDLWNQMIEGYGRTLIQERKTVKKLRAALDEHAPPTPKATKADAFPRLAVGDNERKFERFIRFIRQTNTPSDARRFRSEVASQLRKESEVEGQDEPYLRRLETGKRLLDERIAQLGAGGAEPGSKMKKRFSLKRSQNGRRASKPEGTDLRDVLHNASGLSYFMEYMDRQRLMSLVQFWIVVDGFRNPLEEDNDEPAGSATWTESDRADIAQINEAYLSRSEIGASSQAREVVRQFLKAGAAASPKQYQAARRTVLQAQTDVRERMQDPYFQNFRKSDLYFKWLASDHAASIKIGSPTRSEPEFRVISPTVPKPSRPGAAPRLSTSTLAPRVTDLRRAAVSSSNLKDYAKPSNVESSPRRSLDEASPRKALFDDDAYDTDPLAQSTQSLDSEATGPAMNGNNEEIVDAMQAALNDIMGDKGQDRESLFSQPSARSPQESDSPRGSFELPRPTSPASQLEREKKSIASLGLIGNPGKRSFFEDDLFGEEAPKFIEDEREDSDINEKIGDEIHEAAPGDLGLAEAIDALTLDIEKLVTQESIIDSLMKKAELTNNAAELRILKKSKASLQREINRKELQRQQYIVQESDNSLYGKTSIMIQKIMVGNDEDGKEFALYVIEVRKQAAEQMPAAGWVVARRYSEFYELNKRLRAKFPAVRNLDFPHRQMVLKLQKDFLQKRRLALERYLRELLRHPAVCRSLELRAFLSQHAISPANPNNSQIDQRDFVSRIYNSVTDGMEEFLGNIPVLDQLSLAGQNLISAATTQLNSAGAPVVPGHTAATTANLLAADPDTAAEAEAELRAFEGKELEPFVKPICDLFLELFSLNRESNWLRGRAVVVVLHQLLGGTIERKVRENFRTLLAEEKVVSYLDVARETMWPGGKMRQGGAPRTAAERERTRKEAEVLLGMLVPDLAGSVVGRANAQMAGRRVAAVFNNQRLK